jgi:hypothetical protein
MCAVFVTPGGAIKLSWQAAALHVAKGAEERHDLLACGLCFSGVPVCFLALAALLALRMLSCKASLCLSSVLPCGPYIINQCTVLYLGGHQEGSQQTMKGNQHTLSTTCMSRSCCQDTYAWDATASRYILPAAVLCLIWRPRS